MIKNEMVILDKFGSLNELTSKRGNFPTEQHHGVNCFLFKWCNFMLRMILNQNRQTIKKKTNSIKFKIFNRIQLL